jgi:hypothetical protein
MRLQSNDAPGSLNAHHQVRASRHLLRLECQTFSSAQFPPAAEEVRTHRGEVKSQQGGLKHQGAYWSYIKPVIIGKLNYVLKCHLALNENLSVNLDFFKLFSILICIMHS